MSRAAPTASGLLGTLSGCMNRQADAAGTESRSNPPPPPEVLLKSSISEIASAGQVILIPLSHPTSGSNNEFLF